MHHFRVIPCLLLVGTGLYKTVKFSSPKYIGDPINAVHIFNSKEVDEILILDIMASKEKSSPQYKVIQNIASECFMPLSYGGGVSNIEQMKKIFNIGVEKIALNAAVLERPELVSDAAKIFGNQSIIVSIDVIKSGENIYRIFNHAKNCQERVDLVEYAILVETLGAGELLINSVDRDGTLLGYDIDLIKSIANVVDIPVIALGGAGKLTDFREAIEYGGASAVAAGSRFVYYGRHNSVLINYPTEDTLTNLFSI